MTHDEFMIFVDGCVSKCKRLLTKKRKWRETEGNRLRQFQLAGAITGQAPASAAGNIAVKQTTQLFLMLQALSGRGDIPTMKEFEEVLKDDINYRLLIWANLSEWYE